ncbi:hypothetical protein MNEG_12608 [Monoraphidium neglectum]|uniref:protein-serine/threonine phosphatase n=1 Tax=Monoraphidium neglectum TaxID=145388 RepID=A0A0D2KHQ2_9CHLO|nr:hypothetical protein MNEG_12608 [Monoraphidium neglectum]KIY95353.1 hypothetical protein MNEG_12608 [Monoraphidium neglectum]|eukprot:XP_013894373.1 hypothetical protein MNEG_12608 [Monoraphidium neglectum]
MNAHTHTHALTHPSPQNQVGHHGNQAGANLFCVFDGHGSHGKDAATYSRQVLPALLDIELKKFFARNSSASDPHAAESLKGAVEVLLGEVFSETEKSLTRAGVNLANSGTTASVVYQLGNRLWTASAGDSRVILCQRAPAGPGHRASWRPQPLTIDHRPRRLSERARVEAAGARVQPKRLASGRLVCDIVTESPDPHIACRRVLDAALFEWEERMSADNITVLVVEFDWGDLDRSTEDDLDPRAALSAGAAAAAAGGG